MMPEPDKNQEKSLRVSICAKRNDIMVGKGIIKQFGNPTYICLRINRKRDSFIITPSDPKERLSFRVPDNLFAPENKDRRQFIITSKTFILEIFEKNKLDFDKNYMIPGTYYERENAVLFNVADAYVHMLSEETKED